jgi:hypothetical protein
MSSLTSLLTNDRIIADSGADSGFLLARPEVTGSGIGTTGYCLDRRMSLIAGGGLGRKIAAAASFQAAGWLSPATHPAPTSRRTASPPRSTWSARRTTTRSPPSRPSCWNACSLTPESTAPSSSTTPTTDSRCPTTRPTTPKRTPGTGKHSTSSTGPASTAPEAQAMPAAHARVTRRAHHGGWSRAHIAADLRAAGALAVDDGLRPDQVDLSLSPELEDVRLAAQDHRQVLIEGKHNADSGHSRQG